MHSTRNKFGANKDVSNKCGNKKFLKKIHLNLCSQVRGVRTSKNKAGYTTVDNYRVGTAVEVQLSVVVGFTVDVKMPCVV